MLVTTKNIKIWLKKKNLDFDFFFSERIRNGMKQKQYFQNLVRV